MLSKEKNIDSYLKWFYLTTGYKTLKLDPSKDRLAVKYTYYLTNCERIKETWVELKEAALNKEKAIIIGPDLSQFKKNRNLFTEDSILIGVDGASYMFFHRTGKMPDIIVSDLDGPLRLYYLITEMNKYIAIHPHGDNIHRLAHLASLLKYDKIIVTTQTEDFECIRNVGGFTDGDRAILLALELGFNIIHVCCFKRRPLFAHKNTLSALDTKSKEIKMKILFDLIKIIKDIYGDKIKFTS